MTSDEVQAIIRGIAPVIRERIEAVAKSQTDLIADLERRMAEIERRLNQIDRSASEKSSALKVVQR